MSASARRHTRSNKREQSTFRSSAPIVLEAAFRAHARADGGTAQPYVLAEDVPKLLRTMGVFANKERVERFVSKLDR
jgi:hypothetical protein